MIDASLLTELADSDEEISVGDALVNASVEEALTDEGVEAGVAAPVEEELDEDSSVLLLLALSLEENSVADTLIEEELGVGVAETLDDESDDDISLVDAVVLSEDNEEAVVVEPDSVADAIDVKSDAGAAGTIEELSDGDFSVLVVLVALSLDKVSAAEVLIEVEVADTLDDESEGTSVFEARETSLLKDVVLSVEEPPVALVADAESVEEVALSAADNSVLDETSLAEKSMAEALDEDGVGAEVADSTDDEPIVEELLETSLPVEVDSEEALVVGDWVSTNEV